jgi:hypothetical protein
MSLSKRGKYWWYEFWFAGRRIQESSKSASKSVAKLAEQKRRRELEEGFNSIEDQREEQVRTIRERAKAYFESYVLRNQSATFAGNTPSSTSTSTSQTGCSATLTMALSASTRMLA